MSHQESKLFYSRNSGLCDSSTKANMNVPTMESLSELSIAALSTESDDADADADADAEADSTILLPISHDHSSSTQRQNQLNLNANLKLNLNHHHQNHLSGLNEENSVASMTISRTRDAGGGCEDDFDGKRDRYCERDPNDDLVLGIASGFCFDTDTVHCLQGDESNSDTARIDNVRQNLTGNANASRLWQTLTSHSTYTSEDTQSAEREIVMASTALMGENILDSPVETYSRTSPSSRIVRSECMATKMPSAPNLGASKQPNKRLLPVTGSSYTTTSNTLQPVPALPATFAIRPLDTISKRSASSDSASQTTGITPANDLSVGIMAQGLAWARRQRDRRQRQYLQHQAEQQLHKIRHARALEQNDTTTASTLLDNPTYQNLMHLAASKTKTSSNNNESSQNYPTKPCDASKSLDPSDVAVSTSGDGYSVALPFDITMDHNEEEDASWVPAVRVEDEVDMELCPFLLSLNEMQQVAENVLPRGISYCKWKRHYSLARDGDSFDACMRNVVSEKQSLLVVRTSRDKVFGGFADAPWGEGQMGFGASYYGGPNACLFRIDHSVSQSPASTSTTGTNATTTSGALEATNDVREVKVSREQHCDENVCDDPLTTRPPKKGNNKLSTVKCFHWTGANRYIQLCDTKHKMLAFGGGGNDGSFGLCVEQDFQLGSTGSCSTFDNEPLCDQESFEIVDLEIYGFLTGQF